ncbi:unnamed protein product [Medioppia subpectinata]|uniref:Uncharacterized protein n=1 Tax=Medioppia subpectinata TaxID=1979941 RepID=A0A7R9KUI9_9ACAR|nr:unnamed protein product [Medioppia subpectinata]CAG2108922.1 unnamed protein product [Medioppia subpectinata]
MDPKMLEYLRSMPESESANDYGEEPTEQDMTAVIGEALGSVATLMRAATAQYIPQGLTVPALMYADIIAFVTEKLPWCAEQLRAIPDQPVDIRHAQMSMFVGEINGMNIKAKRVAALRAGRDFKITGSEAELMAKYKQLEKKILYMLDHVIKVARHPFWSVFHVQIKEFWLKEFPKLEAALNKLPAGDVKLRNIQLVIMDLTHILLPPL